MTLPTLAQVEDPQAIVYHSMQQMSQSSWSLINQWLGTEVWISHEIQTSVGAFKLRGSLVFLKSLKQTAFAQLLPGVRRR